jgi:hypothetical protein
VPCPERHAILLDLRGGDLGDASSRLSVILNAVLYSLGLYLVTGLFWLFASLFATPRTRSTWETGTLLWTSDAMSSGKLNFNPKIYFDKPSGKI